MPNSKIFRGKIPWTFVLRERNVCFRSPKCTKTLLQQCLIQTVFRGQYIPRTPVIGEGKICFCSPKMHHNSPTAMWNSKNFPGDNTPDPRFRGEKSWFYFSENVSKRSYSNAEFQKIPKLPNPPFLGKRGKSCLLLKLCLATPLRFLNSIFLFHFYMRR